MAVNNIRKVVADWYKFSVKPQVKEITSRSYVKEALVGALVAVVIMMTVWGYRSYRAGKEENAQLALAEAIYAYQQAASKEKGITYAQAEALLQEGYDTYASSRVAPFFLVFKVEALTRQGKREQALESIDKVITMIPEVSPLQNVYKAEAAIIRLDSDDETVQQAGLEALKSLAFDEGNAARDSALYYLGSYYWSRNDIEQAKDAWKVLAQLGTKDKLNASNWAKQVQEKLAQCGA